MKRLLFKFVGCFKLYNKTMFRECVQTLRGKGDTRPGHSRGGTWCPGRPRFDPNKPGRARPVSAPCRSRVMQVGVSRLGTVQVAGGISVVRGRSAQAPTWRSWPVFAGQPGRCQLGASVSQAEQPLMKPESDGAASGGSVSARLAPAWRASAAPAGSMPLPSVSRVGVSDGPGLRQAPPAASV